MHPHKGNNSFSLKICADVYIYLLIYVVASLFENILSFAVENSEFIHCYMILRLFFKKTTFPPGMAES